MASGGCPPASCQARRRTPRVECRRCSREKCGIGRRALARDGVTLDRGDGTGGHLIRCRVGGADGGCGYCGGVKNRSEDGVGKVLLLRRFGVAWQWSDSVDVAEARSGGRGSLHLHNRPDLAPRQKRSPNCRARVTLWADSSRHKREGAPSTRASEWPRTINVAR